MKRILVLLGLLGGVAIGGARMLQAGPGTVKRTTGRAAETIRRRGPGVAEQAAHGIEELGEAAEKGAQRVRKIVSHDNEPSAAEPPEDEEQRVALTSDVGESREG